MLGFFTRRGWEFAGVELGEAIDESPEGASAFPLRPSLLERSRVEEICAGLLRRLGALVCLVSLPDWVLTTAGGGAAIAVIDC